ncbi:MAG: hypothetical protein JXA42_06845 [Anaerolineales bacterium]|nr:hypothetical protein [Anaerolineales bacterium]
MYPEDSVLVAIMTSPQDFLIAQNEGWYRIPMERAPKGIHAEYLAFYFNRAFGEKKWAIHYYCRQLGHELVRRRMLFPQEPNHPRADNLYFKLSIGPLRELDRPIVSLHWRRISFIHTTWDRFIDASEINDLYVKGEPYVDRLYYALREEGIFSELDYYIEEQNKRYQTDLAIPCKNGTVSVMFGKQSGPPSAINLSPDRVTQDTAGCVRLIRDKILEYGGIRTEII